jgi:hypothetical protein
MRGLPQLGLENFETGFETISLNPLINVQQILTIKQIDSLLRIVWKGYAHGFSVFTQKAPFQVGY